MTWSDEKISAFLDDELDRDESDKIKRAMEVDDILKARIETFLRVDDTLLGALGSIEIEAVPETIMERVRSSSVTANDNRERGQIVPLRPKARASSWILQLGAIAATLMVGVFLGAQLMVGSPNDELAPVTAGIVAKNSPLFAMLETTPSGNKSGKFEPVLSFQAEGGDICREFLAPEQRAMACRSEGEWTVLAVSFEETVRSSDTYDTASAASSLIFDILSDQLMVGAPLSRTEEQDVLSRSVD